MNDRLHACLDGELTRDHLDAGERVRLDALDAVVQETVRQVRARPMPDIATAVMRTLPKRRAPRSAAWRAAVDWFWRPQPLRLRPAVVLAAVVAALALHSLFVAQDSPVRAATDPDPAQILVQFRFQADGARRVELTGTFTGWRPHPLVETAAGVWSATLPVTPGVHDYTFRIDGERWVNDPLAQHVPDSFGGTNSRLSLLPPQQHS